MILCDVNNTVATATMDTLATECHSVLSPEHFKAPQVGTLNAGAVRIPFAQRFELKKQDNLTEATSL